MHVSKIHCKYKRNSFGKVGIRVISGDSCEKYDLSTYNVLQHIELKTRHENMKYMTCRRTNGCM